MVLCYINGIIREFGLFIYEGDTIRIYIYIYTHDGDDDDDDHDDDDNDGDDNDDDDDEYTVSFIWNTQQVALNPKIQTGGSPVLLTGSCTMLDAVHAAGQTGRV